MQLPAILLLCNLVATLYMVGLIWMVQIVHYPLFAKVGQANSEDYQKSHQSLTTFVVGPPMLVEAFSSVFLLWYPPGGVSPGLIIAGIVLVFVIWISTAALQVPCHGKLASRFDPKSHSRLIRSNWIRTVAWTARAVLVIWMLVLVVPLNS